MKRPSETRGRRELRETEVGAHAALGVFGARAAELRVSAREAKKKKKKVSIPTQGRSVQEGARGAPEPGDTMKASTGCLLLLLAAAVTDVGAKGREGMIKTSIFMYGVLILFLLSCPPCLPAPSLHSAGVLRESFQLALPLMDVLFVFFWLGQLSLFSRLSLNVRPCALTALRCFPLEKENHFSAAHCNHN